MSFTLSIFLIPYFLFLLVWLGFVVVAVYHMLRFGFKNFTTFFTTFIFIAVAGLMLWLSYKYLSPIDWSAKVTIFDNLINPKDFLR